MYGYIFFYYVVRRIGIFPLRNASSFRVFEEDGVEYPFAEIEKDRVTFYKACDITVMLRTTDGSGLSDSVIIFCNDVTDVEDD